MRKRTGLGGQRALLQRRIQFFFEEAAKDT